MSENPTSHPDVVDILTADHQDMLALVRQITTSPDAQQRRDLADTVIAEVMRHTVAEEKFVYPVVEKHVPGGADEVEHDKEEHEELIAVMKRMEDADATDPHFMELVGEFEELLDHHARDEEDEQFPKLRQNVPREDLIDLGQKVDAAKRAAPTRPHPHVPHSELFHKTVGPGVGMIDRLRDQLTGRVTD